MKCPSCGSLWLTKKEIDGLGVCFTCLTCSKIFKENSSGIEIVEKETVDSFQSKKSSETKEQKISEETIIHVGRTIIPVNHIKTKIGETCMDNNEDRSNSIISKFKNLIGILIALFCGLMLMGKVLEPLILIVFSKVGAVILIIVIMMVVIS